MKLTKILGYFQAFLWWQTLKRVTCLIVVKIRQVYEAATEAVHQPRPSLKALREIDHLAIRHLL